MRPLAFSALAISSTVFAEEMRADVEAPEPEPARTYVDLRVGASSGNRNGKPEICLEGTPLAFLSLEACGTGAGILHESRDPEMAHFRAKIRPFQWVAGEFTFDVLFGVGIAEYQIDRDAPGFRFTDTGKDRVETAGPELSGHLRVLLPIVFGIEAIADLAVGAAYLRHAPDLVVPASQFQPTISLGIGSSF
jgi:hypothetical protein